ncbi:porin [Bacteroides sp. 214]|uniref:porin n=1 Tax=Bacteroides sp. 214 TaxID=2302935 RepID=UPI0013D78D41|nr:porin [Bacteroides sp. 214]NDW12389.1 porin [Bacteroides sp. 214]
MKRYLLCLAIILAIPVVAQETLNTVINTLKERITLQGYAQAGYTYDDAEDPDNTFDIKRIIFIMDGKITDKWSCTFMYDFKQGGSLVEYYTDYSFLPGLSARFGQYKIPFTIENPFSASSVELIDSYFQSTLYMAGVNNSDKLLGGSSGRDIGLMLYGDLFNKFLSYRIAIMNGQGINQKDRNNQKDIIGGIDINPTSWLMLATSFMKGKGHAMGTTELNPSIQYGDNYNRNRWAIGGTVKLKDFTLRSEYMIGKDRSVKSEGYYAVGTLTVLPKFDVIAAYDYLNKSKEINAKQTNYIAGVQYWFYPRCRLQAQYTYSDKKQEDSSNKIQLQVQVRF